MKKYIQWWKTLCERCLLNSEEKKPMKLDDDISIIHEAQEELSTARCMLGYMEDPEMVEWAVYNIAAAEKRYNYLLKDYRKKKQSELSQPSHRVRQEEKEPSILDT
ncbi:MAG: DUF2508 family protein [Syntrophomonas sp.]|nr:DUF2508 family protein [Syntrophomonas sp.]